MSSSASIDAQLGRLEKWFSACSGALVAFSGGVDSSLVAFLARHYLGPQRCLAVISASPSLKMSELESARTFARGHAIPLEVIVTREMENPDYLRNPANRCYYCKQTLYTELEELRARFPGWQICNGQNTDDLGDYRPGLQAALEHAVRAPLAECGIGKQMVRDLAAHFGLACWDKPASPCLSSRVPYGEEITVRKLRQIERAEAVLLAAGFNVCRVRHYGDTARIEVPPERVADVEAMLPSIHARFRGLGFTHTIVDREGFVSGKLNRALKTG